MAPPEAPAAPPEIEAEEETEPNSEEAPDWDAGVPTGPTDDERADILDELPVEG